MVTTTTDVDNAKQIIEDSGKTGTLAEGTKTQFDMIKDLVERVEALESV